MVYHTLFMMARTGFLTGEQPEGRRLIEPHREVARRIGEEAIVLAKNEKGVLPLEKAKTKKLVVFGQIADLKVAHLGSSCETHPEYEISFLDGLKEYLGDDCAIVKYPLGSEGCSEPLAINLQDLTTFDPNGRMRLLSGRGSVVSTVTERSSGLIMCATPRSFGERRIQRGGWRVMNLSGPLQW